MRGNIKTIARLTILAVTIVLVICVAVIACVQSGVTGLILYLASIGWIAKEMVFPILENWLVTQVFTWSKPYEHQRACSTIRFWCIRLALYIMPILSGSYKRWKSHRIAVSSEDRKSMALHIMQEHSQDREQKFDYDTFLIDSAFLYLSQNQANVIVGKLDNPVSLIPHSRRFIKNVRRSDRFYRKYINDVKREIPHLRNREEYEALRMFINWGVTSGWSPRTTGKDFSFMLNDFRKNNASIPFILSGLFSTEDFSRWQPCFVERYTCKSCGNDTKIWNEYDADIMTVGECRLCSNHDSLTGRDKTYRLGHLATKRHMELRTYLSSLRLPNSRIRELLGDLH